VVDPAQEEEHCKKIFNQRAWTKTNPTPSDSELAEKLVSYTFVFNVSSN
jgi:hypothetical protein